VASYQAKLDLLVTGTDRIRRLEKEINQLEAKINKINKSTTTDVSKDFLKRTVQGYKEVAQEVEVATKNTRQQLMQQLKLNSAVRLYERRLKEIQEVSVGKKEDREAVDELVRTFNVFKNLGDTAGINEVATQLGRISETNRQISRVEQQRNANMSAFTQANKQILDYEAQGLNVAKARKKLDKFGEVSSTNQIRRARVYLDELKRQLKVLSEQSRELKRQRQETNKQKGSAIIGGAFPLLFGQGPGAAAGGAIGGAIGESLGVGGFAGSLAGTAIGNALDTAVQKAAELGNALNSATQNMQGLRDAGVEVTDQTQLQVEAALKIGDAFAAQQLATKAVAQQTGDLDGRLARLASGSISELQKAWNGIVNAVSTTVGVLAAPFINAITVILRGVQGVFVAFNAIVSAAEKLLRLIPGFAFLTDALADQALVTSQTYQERQVELAKEAQTLEKNLATQKASVEITKQSIGFTAQQNKLLKYQAERAKIVADNIKSVQDKRVELGAARTPQEERKQQRIIFAIEEQGKEKLKELDFKIQADLFNTRKRHNKEIADFNEATLKKIEQLNISVERKIFNERLKAQRGIEDARLRSLQASLDLEIQLTREIQERRSAATAINNLYRTIGANLSGAPQASAKAELQNAVAVYKDAVQKTQEDRALAEKKIALDLQKSTVKIERLKLDNAIAIGRINKDNERKVAEIKNDIVKKQRAQATYELGVVKFRADARIKETIANLKADNARREESLKTQQFGAMGQRRNVTDPVIEQNKKAIKELEAYVTQLATSFRDIESKIPKLESVTSASFSVAEVPDTSEALSLALQDEQDQLATIQRKIAAQKQITGEQKAAADLVIQTLSGIESQSAQLDQIGKTLEQNAAYQGLYREQITNGVNPALAEQLITTKLIGDQLVANIDSAIGAMQGLEGFEQDIKNLMDLKGEVEGRVLSLQAAQIQQFKGPLDQFIQDSTDQLLQLEEVGVRVAQGIGDAIGSSLASGITSLIEGSESVQEVFANMLKSIGQLLVQEGTKMIATYIAIGIAKAFAGMGSSTPKIGTDTNYFSQDFNPMSFIQPRANGGPVSPNNTYMVGENGPEFFRPTQAGRIDSNSDMRAAMSRQRNAGPSMNFSFETTNIGGTEYVSREQLEAAMAVTRKQAASDGAKRGMNMTLDKMQHSPATRRRVGI